MTAIDEIPRIDVEPETGAQPRQVSFQAPMTIRRRNFMRTLAVGGMALGVTVLGWVPLGKRAAATVGTEHLNCSVFSSSDSIICTPQV